MPKPNLEAMLPENAVESSGALAGKFEVLTSNYKVHKDKDFEPKPGQKPRLDRDGNPLVNNPMMALVWSVTPLTDDGERIEDAEARDVVLKMGGKSLSTFHPGKGDGPDDSDPEDLGDELNTEGNTLFTSGGDVVMNAKSGYTVFMKSLQFRGFPKEKIAECWAPHFKGLKFELVTVTPEKLEKYGQKKGEANKEGEGINYKVCEAIIALPAKAKKSKKDAEPEAPAPKAKAKAKPAAEDEDDAPDADAATAEAIRVLGTVGIKLAGRTKSFDQVKTFWITAFSDPKTKGKEKLKDAARALVNDDKWLAKQLTLLDAEVDKTDKTVEFAKAAAADDDDDA